MLQYILNCGQTLGPLWHLDYGITSRRNATLLAAFPERNSFAHPESETALTLFILGNIDRWKQVGQFGLSPPRFANSDRWNRSFFESYREGRVEHAFPPPSWSRLTIGPFADPDLDLTRATLLFEFEIMNRAFHEVEGQVFKSLSSLDLKGNRCWGQFDAFLIIPARRPDEGRKGVLVGFETKLASDISRHTEGFPYVNQVIRNLEAGYWLTHHERSLYRRWQFHYVFVCPQIDSELMSTYYSWLMKHPSEAIDSYVRILTHHGVSPEPAVVHDFREWSMGHSHITNWSTLADVLKADAPDLFPSYIRRMAEFGVSLEVRAATEVRLNRAGIKVD